MFPFCNLFKVHYNKGMFDLQIDKKKEKQKMSSMNKSCEKKQQQHIIKIFYM